MIVHTTSETTELFQAAVAELRSRVPDSWSVEPSTRGVTANGGAQQLESAIDIRAPNGTSTTLAVEAKQSFAPRDVGRVLAGLAGVLQRIAFNSPVLVVAPWLSPRTQALLEAEGMNFIDLAGNASLTLDNPGIFIRATGATRIHSGHRRVRHACVDARPLV